MSTFNKKLEVSRKFGSFHSSNIEEQIKASEDVDYIAPTFPVDLPDFHAYKQVENISFGRPIKEKHFLLDKEWIYLNHGAFGCVLKEAQQTCHQLQDYIERQPVRFIDRELFPLIVHSQRRLADLIGCKPSDICFVENATMGSNVVLNSMNFDENDTIYFLSTVYGAVKKSLKQIERKSGVKLQEEQVAFPIKNKEDILKLVRNTLLPTTSLAVFDHVPSNAAFVMPVNELVEICHERNVRVLIDGAHALGAIHLNLLDIDADYYVTNAHKWFCCPKGCALLYVKPELQHKITALTVSHGHGYGFQSELTYTGLKDYSPYIALECCMNFWESVGHDEIRRRIKRVLYEAVTMLMDKWNGGLLAPLDMHGSMCCISVPGRLYENRNVTFDCAEELQNKLFHDYSIEVPVKVIDGKLYVRISVHVYNEIDEYESLADAVLNILNDMK